MPWRNLHIRVTSMFFARSLSTIRQIVSMYDVVDQFLLKPFWFFHRILSISDSMRLNSIINLSRYGRKGYATVVLRNFEVAFLGERVDAAFCPSLLYSGYLQRGCIGAVSHRISLSSILLVVFHLDRQLYGRRQRWWDNTYPSWIPAA